MKTHYIPADYLDLYLKQQPFSIEKHLEKLSTQSSNEANPETSIAKAAVYSSMIEGNPIDYKKYRKYQSTGIKKESLLYRETFEIALAKSAFYSATMEGSDLQLDEYLKYQFPWMKTNTRYFTEIRELISAYEWAISNSLNIVTFLKTHEIFSQTLLTKPEYRGKFRMVEAGVYKGRLKIYSATPPARVESEMNKLFADIEILIHSNLTAPEVFYFASMIHLVFVHIHPFADGNGRAARLLEKWFLAQKLGAAAWYIPSEMLYFERIMSYYQNINIGVDYEHADYDLCMSFLFMLPMSLSTKKLPHV
ncbi:MAG: Fic family protein [Bacteroidales bacterium]|jgi:Fic family protein